jgi:Ser/Thr protein kinase RdoA (MazF antagonist)
MSAEQQVESLQGCVIDMLTEYGLSNAAFESINHEFNSTFKVTTEAGELFALRVNVNSRRSLPNLLGELALVNAVQSVATPKPVATLKGDFVVSGWHEASGRQLYGVLYSWLDGVELGDEPTAEQIFALGVAMAKLHKEFKGYSLPADAALPDLSDFLWGEKDNLLGDASELSSEEKTLVLGAKARITEALNQLAAEAHSQPIHADIHPWNVMWHEGEISVFDFDDSGIGLPIQDLATALYYLDTPVQEAALLEGYKSVAELPKHNNRQLKLLYLQRRIMLLNYLFATTYPKHRDMISEYLPETIRRIRAVLAS